MHIQDNRSNDIVVIKDTTVGEVYVMLGRTDFIPYMRISVGELFINLATGHQAEFRESTLMVWLPDAKLLATKP